MSGAGTLPAFRDEIAAWAVPGLAAPHIAAGITPGLRDETVRALLHGSTAARASRLLATQLGAIDPASLDPADAELLIAPAARLDAIAAGAGCIWHATRVRALLRGADIAALVGRFGEPARAAALRHAPPPDVAASDDLAADIAQDSARCIDAWIDQLPGPASARMRLVRPAPSEQPDRAPLRVKLVRQLASETTA